MEGKIGWKDAKQKQNGENKTEVLQLTKKLFEFKTQKSIQ